MARKRKRSTASKAKLATSTQEKRWDAVQKGAQEEEDAKLWVINAHFNPEDYCTALSVPTRPQVASLAPFYTYYVSGIEEARRKNTQPKDEGKGKKKRGTPEAGYTAEEWLYKVPHLVVGRHSLIPHHLSYPFLSRLQGRVVYVNRPALHALLKRELRRVDPPLSHRFSAPYYLVINYSETGNEIYVNENTVLHYLEAKVLEEGDILSFLESAFDTVGGVLESGADSSDPTALERQTSLPEGCTVGVRLDHPLMENHTTLGNFCSNFLSRAFQLCWSVEVDKKDDQKKPSESSSSAAAVDKEALYLKPPVIAENARHFLRWIEKITQRAVEEEDDDDVDGEGEREKKIEGRTAEYPSTSRERSLTIVNNHLIEVVEEDRAGSEAPPIRRDRSVKVGPGYPPKGRRGRRERQPKDTESSSTESLLGKWFALLEDADSGEGGEPLSPLQCQVQLNVSAAKRFMRRYYADRAPPRCSPTRGGEEGGGGGGEASPPARAPSGRLRLEPTENEVSPIKLLLDELRGRS